MAQDESEGASERGSLRKPPRRALGPWATLALGALALTLTGCGHGLFAIQARSASSKLAEARAMHAPDLAPYEYYSAAAHLEKAKQEAAEADYSDAIDLAEASEEYADQAIELSGKARQGAGR